MYNQENKIEMEKEDQHLCGAYAIMADLLEKLKILKYESEFISSLKMKPIHRYYFIVPKNPGEQFYLFSSLAAWLIRKSGKSIEPPQEYDDPNTTIANILDIVRESGIAVDFPPNKLKQGVGEHVVFILDHLADQALQHANFAWKRYMGLPDWPEPTEDVGEEAEVIEDEAEIILDRIEEEMMAAYSDDSEEENIFNINDLSSSKSVHKREFEAIENIDVEAWKLELERVLPQLKVTIKSDSRDWRSHLDQMKTYRSNIENSLTMTKTNLDKLHKEISVTLDKISNRERYLNKELEPVLDEYRILQDQLSKVKEAYRNISGGVTERTRHLASLTDKMETIKQQMEERGSSMTDGTPLVNIKKAIAKIKTEITEMDIRVAVLDCVLLQAKIREKNLLDQDLYQTNTIY